MNPLLGYLNITQQSSLLNLLPLTSMEWGSLSFSNMLNLGTLFTQVKSTFNLIFRTKDFVIKMGRAYNSEGLTGLMKQTGQFFYLKIL